MSNHWPATAKQRGYGISLEEALGIDHASWTHLSVDEARERIGMLIALRSTTSEAISGA